MFHMINPNLCFLHGLKRTIHTPLMNGSANMYLKEVERTNKIEESFFRGEPQPVPVSIVQGAESSMSMQVVLPPY